MGFANNGARLGLISSGCFEKPFEPGSFNSLYRLHPDSRNQGIKESVDHLAELIVMFKNREEPENVERWLKDVVFKLDPSFAGRQSGGSAPDFAKRGARIIYPGKP